MMRAPVARRGAVYIIVLGCTALLSMIALAALSRQRADFARQSLQADALRAQQLAEMGLDRAQRYMNQDGDWRSSYPVVNVDACSFQRWDIDHLVDRGSFSISAVDTYDGHLANWLGDPVRVTSTGVCNGITARVERLYQPEMTAVSALGYSIHAASAVVSGTLNINGPALSVNGQLQVDGRVNGDAVCASVVNSSRVNGLVSTSTPARALPASSVISKYKAIATTITYSGDIDRVVLAPGVNTYSGAASPEGIYFLDTAGRDITIRRSRIYGTLIVVASGARIRFNDSVSLAPARSDLASLVLSCGIAEINLSNAKLSESDEGVNFNPSPGRYDQPADADKYDSYTSRLDGLIYVSGATDLSGQTGVNGAVVITGALNVYGAVNVAFNPELNTSPPRGFANFTRMTAVPGSSNRQVAP